MKIFKIDLRQRYIIFEDNERAYAVTFYESNRNGITDVRFSIGNKGDRFLDVKDIKVIATRPNLLERTSFLVALLLDKLRFR